MNSKLKISAAIILIIGIFIVVIILLVVYFFSSEEMTQRENGILGILLTTASIIGTWVFSSLYSSISYKNALDEAKESYQSSLRTYALRASEKVFNLSDQLSGLSQYLQSELEVDYDDLKYEALSRVERILSAIQIVDSLKSFNDTSLRDWHGVIGDELDQQKAEKEKKDEMVFSQIEILEEKINQLINVETKEKDNQNDIPVELKFEFDLLKRDLNLLTRSLGVRLPTFAKQRNKRVKVETSCPECGGNLNYRQKDLINSIKAVECSNCNEKLVSKFEGTKGFILSIRKKINEEIICLICNSKNYVLLDVIPSSSANTPCTACGIPLKIVRGVEEVIIKIDEVKQTENTASEKISDEVLLEIQKDLPEQPWPKETHKIIAKKYGITNTKASQILADFMNKGIFKWQINGKLYVPDDQQ